jgi:hypothetical protein
MKREVEAIRRLVLGVDATMDRASVTFRDGEELREKRTAFEAIVRQWMAHV